MAESAIVVVTNEPQMAVTPTWKSEEQAEDTIMQFATCKHSKSAALMLLL